MGTLFGNNYKNNRTSRDYKNNIENSRTKFHRYGVRSYYSLHRLNGGGYNTSVLNWSLTRSYSCLPRYTYHWLVRTRACLVTHIDKFHGLIKSLRHSLLDGKYCVDPYRARQEHSCPFFTSSMKSFDLDTLTAGNELQRVSWRCGQSQVGEEAEACWTSNVP